MIRRKFEIVAKEFRKFPEIEVKIPRRADSCSCGYDFYSLENIVLKPGEKHLFFTDIKVKMPVDNRLEINTRSGNGTKYGIVLANTIGYIDASYYCNPENDGNIGICLLNLGTEPFRIEIGDKIAQGCFSQYLITFDDEFKRQQKKLTIRKGGFGSTGRK